MKQSNLTFVEGFLGTQAIKAQGKPQMYFNWDKAAEVIKLHTKDHPDLIAEAGLQGDWQYTGGVIFENGKPTNDSYTYLSSNWAKPTLIISWDDEEQLEMDCFIVGETRFNCDSKWDDISLNILEVFALMKTLDEIGLGYQTDKSSPYHNYLNTYEKYFEKFRDQEIEVWELGIGDINSKNREGESAYMWNDYFPFAQIRVFDNDITKVERFNNQLDIDAILLDQTDEAGFKHYASHKGRPTIIIDDASHIQYNTIRSFEILFPLLQPEGLYCIEDTVTSYWPDWGGIAQPFHFTETTIVGFMMGMSHVINLKRQETFNPPLNYQTIPWWREIDSIHFHHSQIIIQKK